MENTTVMTVPDYRDAMTPFLKKLPDFLRTPAFDPALRYYGTGESAHWPVQSNCNIAAALAVLAGDPALDAATRDEARQTALALLRYTLRTHLTGDAVAADGKKWGCHWISVLGLERMAHGLNALHDSLTHDDRARIKRMMLAEARWLLEDYPVVAGMLNSSGRNKPESNIWNGCFLLRTAMDYPDEPFAQAFRDKAASFLANGLSHPSDTGPLHIEPNFTENWSLDHHGYLNVGYMVICLSNIAMFHFWCRERGVEPPPGLYHHVRDLWPLVKSLTFPDGRLLRIGGDTRARYTYCQNYAIPVWLFAADWLGDADATAFEKNWLNVMRAETAHNGDGSFYGKRLARLRGISHFYYTRLESDAFLCLSYGAYWRRVFNLPSAVPQPSPVQSAWQDELHGAAFIRGNGTIRSFVWHGAQGPTALCLPDARSDLAEWQGNLRGEFATACTAEPTQGTHTHTLFPGGFISSGANEWCEANPQGEGEGVYPFARHQTAAAALPDGHTLLILEHAAITKEAGVTEIKGLCFKVPNDLFNTGVRTLRTATGSLVLHANPAAPDHREIPGGWLTIDNAVTFCRIYGSDRFYIRRPAVQNILLRRRHGPFMPSLYADEICCSFETPTTRLMPGATVLDNAAAVTTSKEIPALSQLPQPGLLRAVQCGNYIFAANFGAVAATPRLPGNATPLAGEKKLEPGACALFQCF